MHLSFLGAAREVTGSCHFLEVAGKKILIDCGMVQGPDEKNQSDFPLNPADIDYILVTHAHIDHTGRIPLLTKLGFGGEVHAVDATCDLCAVMLRDSAHIQEFEAEWRNRKAQRAGREPFVPLYTMPDAEAAIKLFVPHEYDVRFTLCDGVDVRFKDAGHLLGSASIEVWASEGETTRKLVFSGDIGNLDQPIINDPEYLSDADYIITESTYGDRSHPARAYDYCERFAEIIQRTFDRGGNVVIPSFAVGRTQELLYYLREIKEKGMVKGHDGFTVYVDSPLARQATEIFRENVRGYYDPEASALIARGINPLDFPGLKITDTSEESKLINFDPEPKIIISASGMCDAGRIKHHLKHNLWRPECTVVFVGFQAIGTVGRSIVDGAQSVKLFGETIEVKAEITQLHGISGHADKDGLLKWIGHFTEKPQRVFVVHGENSVCESFSSLIYEQLGFDAVAPLREAKYDLIKNECIETGYALKPRAAAPAQSVSAIFGELLAAVARLSSLVSSSSGRANKDIKKLTRQINDICDDWER